eukprot:6930989-Alexandrium_andersonii.AAC.1
MTKAQAIRSGSCFPLYTWPLGSPGNDQGADRVQHHQEADVSYAATAPRGPGRFGRAAWVFFLSLIHISEPTRLALI